MREILWGLALAGFLACGSAPEEAVEIASPPADDAGPETERQVLLVGLDAATLKVVEPMVRDGKLPTFASFLREGAWGELQTLHPTLSVIVWTTILTGVRPEEHGIHGWLSESGQQLAFSSDLIGKPPLWRILSSRGVPSLFVNFWATWPAERVTGAMVSNRMHMARTKHRVYPPRLLETLDGIPKPDQLELSPDDPLEGLVFYRRDRYVVEVTREALTRTEPRLTAVFLRGLDLVQHKYWHTVDSSALVMAPDRETRPMVENYYRYMDGVLADLQSRMPDATVVVVSDHGMDAMSEPPPQIGGLNLNRLLERMGFLTFEPRPPHKKGEPIRRRTIRWSETRAYTFGDSEPDLDRGVRVNRVGREETGVVSPDGAAQLLDELEHRLSRIATEDGRLLCPSIRRASHAGPDDPDLLIELNPTITWDDRLTLEGGEQVPLRQLGMPAMAHNSGEHSGAPPGLILMRGPGIRRGVEIRGARVYDVTPTVLALLGLPAGEDMAGAPLTDALSFSPPAAIPSWGDIPYQGPEQEADRSVSEETVQELRDLGYVQ